MDAGQNTTVQPDSSSTLDFLVTQRPFKGRFAAELVTMPDGEVRLPISADYASLLRYGGVVTVGLDTNLLLFSNKHWEMITKVLAQQAGSAPGGAKMVRHIYGRSVEFDGLNADGTITLTDDLLNYAQLDKKVIMVGCIYYAEITAAERYNDTLLSPEDAQKLADALHL